MTATTLDVATASARLTELFRSAAAAAAVKVALDLGVLTRLDQGPAAAADLVSDCRLGSDHAVLLLGALGAIGLVDRLPGGRYRAAFTDIAGLVAWMDGAAALAGALSGRTSGVGVADPDQAAAFYPRVTGHLGALVAAAAAAAAGHLCGLVGESGEVLDVGAGAVPWTLALARVRPRVRVTALDLAPVLAATRRAVTAAGLGGRFTYLSGDAFELAIPREAFDLVVVANLVHLLDDAAADLLLRRLRPALRPGGHIAVVDVLGPEPGDDPDPIVALYALGLVGRSPRGLVRAYAGVRACLERTGYSAVRRIDLDAQPPFSLLVGTTSGGRP